MVWVTLIENRILTRSEPPEVRVSIRDGRFETELSEKKKKGKKEEVGMQK